MTGREAYAAYRKGLITRAAWFDIELAEMTKDPNAT